MNVLRASSAEPILQKSNAPLFAHPMTHAQPGQQFFFDLFSCGNLHALSFQSYLISCTFLNLIKMTDGCFDSGRTMPSLHEQPPMQTSFFFVAACLRPWRPYLFQSHLFYLGTSKTCQRGSWRMEKNTGKISEKLLCHPLLQAHRNQWSKKMMPGELLSRPIAHNGLPRS